MTTFFHFSDFHILPEKGMTRAEGDPCEKIERVIKLAKDTNIKPAFSIITGDISQNGSTSGYEIAKDYFAQIESLGGPVLPVMGNVDERTRFHENLLKGTKLENGSSCYYSVIVDGVRVIVLDSQNPDDHTGILDENQLSWLEKELALEHEPTLIAMHHPTFALHLPNGRKHIVCDRPSMARFQDIVRGSNVKLVLCGHLHQSLYVESNGIKYLVGAAALSESHIEMHNANIYDSLGFNQVTIEGDHINIKPVIYTEERKLLITKKI